MVKSGLVVRDHMSLAPVFIYEKSDIFNALEIMKRFGTQSMPIIKEDFSIVGILDKRKILRMLNSELNIMNLKNIKIAEFCDEYNTPVVLYQKMTILEAYSIMKCLGVNGLPVADFPWEKRMIGYLWMDEIKNIVEEDYVKIPV